MIKIRVVKKPKINLEQKTGRHNCKITKREVEQEYQKKGKKKVPVEKKTITQECEL
tara:strand:- start:350 stop:517 length:168 start_codon:yes stop_codon:yes gene_type:complete